MSKPRAKKAPALVRAAKQRAAAARWGKLSSKERQDAVRPMLNELRKLRKLRIAAAATIDLKALSNHSLTSKQHLTGGTNGANSPVVQFAQTIENKAPEGE